MRKLILLLSTALVLPLVLGAPPALAEPPACNDAIDNDGDGAVDYPNDPDCNSPEDDSEITTDPPTPECDDGIDNDDDGWRDYPKESGCSSPYDATEMKEPTDCADGEDNDGDGSIDYPEDPECFGEDDTSETNIHGDPACAFNGTNCDGAVLEYQRPSFIGAVGDDDRCMYRRRIVLKKVSSGRDKRILGLRTGEGGGFTVKRPQAHGRFYLVAPRVELEELTCIWRRSNTVKIG
ncbi:MAG: hypothetical protein H0U53_03895 [Actinobacteria bacterium]|nr:hypothetical protein [Actinomycetota bacterium]